MKVGDIGYLDSEDYLFINDRKKDMIISGGVNIFPLEIESVLINIEQIVDCAIIGAPHSDFGEMVVAAVQCRPHQSVTLEQVKDFLEGKLAHYNFPKKSISIRHCLAKIAEKYSNNDCANHTKPEKIESNNASIYK